MIKSRFVLAGAMLAVAGAANAGSFSATPAVVSDYDWRGITQTDTDPAFQLGLNYAFDSGFYIGTWGSNVDFGTSKPDVEVDYFAGYSGGDASETFGYDVGVNYYTYLSAGSLNFVELYAGITKGMFGAKVWYSPELQTVVYSKRDDPMAGQSITRLTKIVRAEPDPALFQIPADYTLSEPEANTFHRFERKIAPK